MALSDGFHRREHEQLLHITQHHPSPSTPHKPLMCYRRLNLKVHPFSITHGMIKLSFSNMCRSAVRKFTRTHTHTRSELRGSARGIQPSPSLFNTRLRSHPGGRRVRQLNCSLAPLPLLHPFIPAAPPATHPLPCITRPQGNATDHTEITQQSQNNRLSNPSSVHLLFHAHTAQQKQDHGRGCYYLCTA